MKCLAIDTSTTHLTVTVECDGKLYEEFRSIGLRHSEHLVPLIERLLEEAGIREKGPDLVICSAGPGSFTGLRIGMATVKGMAAGYGIPCVSVPTLDTWAFGLEFFDGIVVPVIDARKGSYYCAAYDHGRNISGFLDIKMERVFDLGCSDRRVLVTGPDSEDFADALTEHPLWTCHEYPSMSRGLALITLGRRIFEAGGSLAPDAGPLYLRKSDAELSLDRMEDR